MPWATNTSSNDQKSKWREITVIEIWSHWDTISWWDGTSNNFKLVLCGHPCTPKDRGGRSVGCLAALWHFIISSSHSLEANLNHVDLAKCLFYWWYPSEFHCVFWGLLVVGGGVFAWCLPYGWTGRDSTCVVTRLDAYRLTFNIDANLFNCF